MVGLTGEDKPLVAALARRRKTLGLSWTYADTIRDAVALASTASDEDLKRGEL